MASLIVLLLLLIACAGAMHYIWQAKKSGTCIGCGEGKCSHNCAHYAAEQAERKKLDEIRAAKAAEEKGQR
ncbi:Virus attachment protein p12 family [Lachnospiraceae bacterium]|nr:Virus attachment protein p12 family [Lachnospiraceae bacterium]